MVNNNDNDSYQYQELNDDYNETNGESTRNDNRVKNHKDIFNAKIKKEYPNKYVIINSLILITFCTCIIVGERMQPDRFTIGDITIVSYRTLDGLVLVSASLNILFSVFAFLTVIFKNYSLIQSVTIFNLIGGIISFINLIAFNIVVLIFSLLGANCDVTCISIRSVMILLGVLISILNIAFFITFQINFIRNLNKNYVII